MTFITRASVYKHLEHCHRLLRYRDGRDKLAKPLLCFLMNPWHNRHSGLLKPFLSLTTSIALALLIISAPAAYSAATPDARRTTIPAYDTNSSMIFGTLRPSSPAKVQGPSQVTLDTEGYPVAPRGLALEQVHVYVRHGEVQRFPGVYTGRSCINNLSF